MVGILTAKCRLCVFWQVFVHFLAHGRMHTVSRNENVTIANFFRPLRLEHQNDTTVSKDCVEFEMVACMNSAKLWV